jgi:3-hydroxybutyrate dehydrogenase
MKQCDVRKCAFAMPLTSPAYPPGSLGISEQEVIRNVMLKETVDGEFTTVEDVAETTLFLASFGSNALTGQSVVVSHGWHMQ